MEKENASKMLRRNFGGGQKQQRPKNNYDLLHSAQSEAEKSPSRIIGTPSKNRTSASPNREAIKWEDLIGYPVCIGGIKEGILRYYGSTKFAEGVWCGVELQEAVGKNDGTVNGVRYFYCRSNHGIFAPVSKISLLSPDKFNEAIGDQNFFRKSKTERSPEKFPSFLKQSSSDSTIQKRVKGSFVSYIEEKNFSKDKRHWTEQRGTSPSLTRSSPRFFEEANNNFSSAQAPCGLSAFGFGKPTVSIPRKVMSEYSLESQVRRTFEPDNCSCPVFTKDRILRSPTISDAPEEFRDTHRHNLHQHQQQHLKSFLPSNFLDFQDDNEDDQISMEYDESLGILTPSEMKDFTLCADFPTTCSDTRALDFPSSESFDEVNDLPEDEQVHDVSVQYLPSGTEVPLSSSPCFREEYLRRPTSDKLHIAVSSSSEPSGSGESGYVTSLKRHLSTLETKNGSHSSIVCFNTETKINVIDSETTRKKSSDEVTYHRNTSLRCSGHLPGLEVETTLQGSGKLVSIDIKAKKNYDTDSGSRDSLLQNDLEQMTFKEKLTVSWEDCITSSSPEEMFHKIERPESVYTVGSNDTGYQEDGEFEADTGMTTSGESYESKRFSSVSRDSCIAEEEIDGDKVGESNSTSGYSTGLSDSYCNEKRPLEDSFHDVVDSCTSDEVLPTGQDHEGLSLKNSEGFFDMDRSAKDGESISDYHITESNTVLGLDSTCETLHEDVTVVEMETEGEREENQNAKFSNQVPVAIAPPPKDSKINSSHKSSEQMQNNTYNVSPKDNVKKPESPRRNVMSKIKAVIGGNRSKNSEDNEIEGKKPIPPKKSRWEAVTARIAASLAEEKTRPKAKKEVRSRVNTNLINTRQACLSPKLDLSSASDGKTENSVASSTSSRSKPTDRNYQQQQRPITKNRDFRPSAHSVGLERRGEKEPRPSKTCSSSRSVSPVAASESSASASIASHHSRSSKIAIWKGSNSTVASSTALIQHQRTRDVPRSLAVGSSSVLNSSSNLISRRTNLVNKDSKPTPVVKLRANASPMSPLSSKLEPLNKPQTTPLTSRQKTAGKEQLGTSPRPLVAPRPVRPPMWLSKAELSQEIQHLSTLCETRTKELNKLKMETRHVTAGFDALAVVIRYMSAELDAFKVPGLITDLKLAEEKIEKGRTDLKYYEKEIQRVNMLHMKEMNKISEQLSAEYESSLKEITEKHAREMGVIKEEQMKEVTCLDAALQASCEEEKLQHLKMLEDLQQELQKQREEMEIFHQHELNDLEELHLGKQKALLDEIEKLQKQCSEAKQLSLTVEEALQKDTDTKLQWLTAKKTDLQNEVDSLKAVLEIKNNELHALRKENLEMQKELEELPLAKEKIKMLQARAEDLQALVAEKVKTERQLSTEHEFMKETYEKEAKVNMRLSMENEELLWRLKQANESSLLSTTLPDECEPADDQDTDSSWVPVLSEEPTPPPSPTKNATPVKTKFFTFMSQDEINSLSPKSPRTQYKRIQPHKSPQAKHVTKSIRTPRRETDSSPHHAEATPRKLARHQNHTSLDEGDGGWNRDSSVDEQVENECFGLPVSGGPEERLRVNSDGQWEIPDEDSPENDCAIVDPKSFYQMAFPVGETSQDNESEQASKETKNESTSLR